MVKVQSNFVDEHFWTKPGEEKCFSQGERWSAGIKGLQTLYEI